MGDTLFSSTRVQVVHEDFMHEQCFKKLHGFQLEGKLCDVTITVKKQNEQFDEWSIQCHRVILACYSDYFSAMFCHDMRESKMGVVSLHDVDKNAVAMLIEFCYTHTITLSVENVQSILHAASVLQMQIVADYCASFISHHLNSSNCLTIREFGKAHGQMGLVKITDDFLKRFFAEVSVMSEFNLLNFEELLDLLKSPDIVVSSEKEVFDAIMRWVKHDSDERKMHLPELMKNVKLPLLSAEELVSNVENEPLLKLNMSCRDLIDEAKNYQISLMTNLKSSKNYKVEPSSTKPRPSYSGFLMIAGGRDVNGEPMSSVECYDVSADAWLNVAPMTVARRHVGIVCHNDFIYTVGGFSDGNHLSSAEKYDIEENNWMRIKSMSKPRRGLGLVNIGKAIYAIGGLTDNTCYGTLERYDPTADDWTNLSTMIIPRGGVATITHENQIYAIGGNDGITSVSSCERYDPLMDKWTKIDSLSKRRAGAGVANLNGLIYVIGGFDNKLALSSVECYDPTKNKWREIGNLNCKRGGIGVATMAGKIYVAGGHDGTDYLDTVEVYDPELEIWSYAGNLRTKRAGAGMTWCSSSVVKLKDVLNRVGS